jgi:pilus assembly protein CpaC
MNRGYAMSGLFRLGLSSLVPAASLLILLGLVTPRTTFAKEDEQVVLQDVQEFNLSVGENKTISARGVKSYSEGVRGMVEVKLTPDGNHFVVVGQKPGSTTLLMLMADGTQVKYMINVFLRAMDSVEHELRELLEGTTGIRIRRVGARFFIEGGVSTEPELRRIERISTLYPDQVESLVVLGGVAAERQLNIRIDFFFVQFDRTNGYQVGMNWPSTVGGGLATLQYDFIANSVTTARASVADQVLPGLDIAANSGWAKVLKHSTIVTSNGSEANFESGGEQNYLVSTNFSAALAQIEFGTRVRALPRFDPATNQLEVRLVAEVLDLTPPVAAGTTLPGRNISKLETLVSLKLGQSIVLSGIRSQAERHATRGLPLLSDIPLLGALFGTQSKNADDVQGVIFVVPSVIESVPKSAREIIDEALVQYRAYDGDVAAANLWEEDPARAPGVRSNAGKPSPRPEAPVEKRP